MKRFCYVCADDGIPIPGEKGASGHVASVCRALTRAGFDGDVYTPRALADDLEGLPIAPIRLPPRTANESKSQREVRLFLGSLDSRLASRGPYDFIYERYSLWHVGGLARARALGVPFILEVNSPLPDEARRYRGLAHDDLARGIARILMGQADGVVCVSEQVGSWVREQRCRDEGVWVVPNGVDPDLFSPGDASRPDGLPPSGVPLIGFCSSFRPWHAVDDLLDAFVDLLRRHSADAHLICVGDGPLREPFEKKARTLGLRERVHTTGSVPQKEVPRWLRGADVAVAPYGPLEQFYFSPLKIFEFLSLGLPVVAADIGQIGQIVGQEERGLLYTPGDIRGLSEALARLLKHPDEARRMGRAGREWVLAGATWTQRVDSILRRIESV